MRIRGRASLVIAAAVGGLAVPAWATHDVPLKANKFLATFVRSQNPCATPSLTHNPPLSFPACTPSAVSASVGFGPKGQGQAKGSVVLNSLKQASDIKLVSTFKDVRNLTTTTCSKTGGPCSVDADCPKFPKEVCENPGFNGTLLVVGTIRTTDHNCGAGTPCTMIDIPFPVPLPCGSAISPPKTAGTCKTVTTANTVVPGAISPGLEGSIGLSQLQVLNGSDVAFEGGLFLP